VYCNNHRISKNSLIDRAEVTDGDESYLLCDLIFIGSGLRDPDRFTHSPSLDPTEQQVKKEDILFRPLNVDVQNVPISKDDWVIMRNRVDRFFEVYQGEARGRLDQELEEANQSWMMEVERKLKEERGTPKKRQKSKGYIYVIKSSEGYFKIGISKKPKNRIKCLGVTLPFPIDVIHTFECDDAPRAETILHATFAGDGKWIRGEWFKLTDQNVERIKSYVCFENETFFFMNPTQTKVIIEKGVAQ